MSPSVRKSNLPSPAETIPNDKYAELLRLQEQVRHAEQHGQTDTAHHAMLARLMKELGITPAKEETNGE